MTPKEQNILDTLNLLVFLFRAQKQKRSKLDEEEKFLLQIKDEHLLKANMTLPLFFNTLELLDRKGYLAAVTVGGEQFQKEVEKLLSDDGYSKMLEKIKDPDAELFTSEGKTQIAEKMDKLAPPDHYFDRKAFMQTKTKIGDILDETRAKLAQHYTPDTVSFVLLFPFRSIERLLDKMNDGQEFDDIQDAGIWYDPHMYELHFGEEKVSTWYQGKANKEHYVLNELLNKSNDKSIYYLNIPEINEYRNTEKGLKAFYDALSRLVKKHRRLEEIFTVHPDHLVINEEYLEHTH